MKKLLSLILVAVMILIAMPVAFAEGETYEVGDIIQFGSYPQSEVKDESLIEQLNALAPAWEDWTSYGYYSGDDSIGSMVQGDWMRYTDVVCNSNKYRGVKFTQYRPMLTWYSSHPYKSYQDDNGYSANIVFWFKFESIDWRILDPSTGLVMCEKIIDSQAYSDTTYHNGDMDGYFSDALFTNYTNDYETSSIRQWLNTDFYNTAFSSSQQNIIKSTTLNNKGYYTLIGTTGYEKFDSNETYDKIFLLSFDEVIDSNLGFDSNSSADDTARQAKGSDYTQCQGLYVIRNSGRTDYNNSHWYLRSPGRNSSGCCHVFSDGEFGNIYDIGNSCMGVRPATRFNLDSEIFNPDHIHSYSSYITAPTCITQGYTIYTCFCSDSYIGDTIPVIGHNFSGSVCTYCGYNRAKDCSCNCHKTGISAIIWKILSFFYKIFKTNSVCTCGVAHY